MHSESIFCTLTVSDHSGPPILAGFCPSEAYWHLRIGRTGAETIMGATVLSPRQTRHNMSIRFIYVFVFLIFFIGRSVRKRFLVDHDHLLIRRYTGIATCPTGFVSSPLILNSSDRRRSTVHLYFDGRPRANDLFLFVLHPASSDLSCISVRRLGDPLKVEHSCPIVGAFRDRGPRGREQRERGMWPGTGRGKTEIPFIGHCPEE